MSVIDRIIARAVLLLALLCVYSLIWINPYTASAFRPPAARTLAPIARSSTSTIYTTGGNVAANTVSCFISACIRRIGTASTSATTATTSTILGRGRLSRPFFTKSMLIDDDCNDSNNAHISSIAVEDAPTSITISDIGDISSSAVTSSYAYDDYNSGEVSTTSTSATAATTSTTDATIYPSHTSTTASNNTNNNVWTGDHLPVLTFMMHCDLSHNYSISNLERVVEELSTLRSTSSIVSDANVITNTCIAMRYATTESIDLASSLLDIVARQLDAVNTTGQSLLSLHQIAECFGHIKVLDFKQDRTRSLVRLLVDQIRLLPPTYVSKPEDVEPCFLAVRWLGNHSIARALLGALNDRLSAIDQPMSAQQLANIAFGVRYFKDCPELRNFLKILRSKLEASSGPGFDGISTEKMVFFLTSIYTRSVARTAAVKEFSRKILETSTSTSTTDVVAPMTLRSLGKSFALLRRISQRWSFPTRHLFNALSHRLRDAKVATSSSTSRSRASNRKTSSTSTTPGDITNCLSAIVTLGPKYRDGKLVAHYISHIINNCSDTFSEDDLAHCINSLKFATSKPSEFRSLVHALAGKVATYPHPLSSSAFSYALNGLKRMGSVSPQVRMMQSALIDRFPDEFGDADALARSFAGMHSMNSKHRETRELLNLLINAINSTYDGNWNAQKISYAMLGLRNMKSHHDEVRHAVTEFSNIIERIPTHNFCASHVRNCFYSLKCMASNTPEVKRLLQLLGDRLEAVSSGNIRALNNSDQDTIYERMAPEMVCQCINGMQAMNGDTNEVKRLLKTFCDILDSNPSVGTTSNNSTLHAPGSRLAGRDIAVCLRGLHGIGSETPEALRLIGILADKMQSCRGGSFDSMCLKASIAGLYAMNDRYSEVSKLLGNMSVAMGALQDPRDIASVVSKLRFLTGRSDGSKRFVSSVTDAISRHVDSPMGVAKHIVPSLHGLRGLQISEPETQSLLRVISDIASRDTESQLTPAEISKGLLGLQFMSSTSTLVHELVAYFHAQISNTTEEFTPLELTGCIQGLSSLPPSAIKPLLSVIAAKINTCKGIFTPDVIESCLYSLKYKLSANAELNEVLAALTSKIVACNDTFTSKNIGVSMLGLQSLSSPSPQLHQLLLALSDKIAAMSNNMSRTDIGSAFYGLQRSSDTSISVRRMVQVLTDKIGNCSHIDPRMLSCTLHGLQSMSGTSREVRQLLAVLSTKAVESLRHLSPQYASAALFGLKRMSIDSIPVQRMVMTLSNLMHNSTEPYSAITLGGAFAALQNMKSHHAATKRLVSVLTRKLETCPDTLSIVALSNIYHSLTSMKVEDGEVVRLLEVLLQRLSAIDSASPADGWDLRSIARILHGHNRIAAVPVVLKTLRLVTKHLRLNNDTLTSDDFSNAMSGLAGLSSSASDVTDLVAALVTKFQASVNSLDMSDIAKSTYGMTSMSSDHKEVRRLLLLLRNQLVAISNTTQHSTSSRRDVMSSDVLIRILLGLKGASSRHREVKQFISTITECIILNPSLRLAPKDFALSLSGLRGMRATDPEVNVLLEALYSRIDDTKGAWNADVLSTALYGLRLMTGKSPIVRSIVRYLVIKLREYKGTFTSRQLGDSMYGLQLMSAEVPEVRELVAVLHSRIQALTEPPPSTTLGYMVYGLRSMSAEVLEVREILKTITGFISASSYNLSSVALCNTISGLQHMDSSRIEVRRHISVACDRIATSTEPFSMQSIGRMMHGLQYMNSSHTEVRRIVLAIAEKMQRSTDTFDESTMYDVFFGLRNLDSRIPEVETFLRALTAKIQQSSYKAGAIAMGNALLHLRHLDTSNDAVRGFLGALLASAKQSRIDSWTSENVFKCMSNLRSLTDGSDEADALIDFLVGKLEALGLNSVPTHIIGKASFGLQHMTGSAQGVRRLLLELDRLLLNSNETATPGVLSSMLLGLRSMTTQSPELKKFLRDVADRVRTCKFSFSPSAITHAIAGLQSMDPSQPEVRLLLGVIGDQVRSCREPLAADQIADILLSMSRIGRSDEPEVRNLLLQLRSKMNVAVDSSIIAEVLASLRSKSSDELKLIEMLVALDSKYRATDNVGSDSNANSSINTDSNSSIVDVSV